MKNFKILSRTEMKAISGGGTCGVNIYDTHGEKIGETRGLSKAAAKEAAADWNENHDSYCTAECNAVAKWCCASC